MWHQARLDKTNPASFWLFTAGARGGVGGFKARHKHRPNVDGFTPNRVSLASRIEAFQPHAGKVRVVCADVSKIDPANFPPSPVFFDPPYKGRLGYACKLHETAAEIARRWASFGHKVAVSEAVPLHEADETIDITNTRKGQTRRSLSIDAVEWLSVFHP